MIEEMERDYRVDPALAAHIWDGEYRPAAEGAYYAGGLHAAQEEGRIGKLAIDPLLPVRCYWDLGYDDYTAIWAAQFVGREIRVLDFMIGHRQPLGYYAGLLRERGWGNALQVLPHDGANVRVETPGSASFQLREAGFNVEVVPNQGRGAAMERVRAAQRLFPSIWFDDEKTEDGRRRLAHYAPKMDKDGRDMGPDHATESDTADSFGLMAVHYQPPRVVVKKKQQYRVSGWMQ
jgi:phage terminase large subunit